MEEKTTGRFSEGLLQVYPFSLGGETAHKSFSRYKEYSANSVNRPYIYNPEEEKFKLIDFGNLDFNGSFSRAFPLAAIRMWF